MAELGQDTERRRTPETLLTEFLKSRPSLSGDQLQKLLQDLKFEDCIYTTGYTKGAR